MIVILKIAWRNLFRHKGKTIVIGMILFFGAWIMTLGNGVISGFNHGLKQNLINSFTGDAVIMSEKEYNEAILFSMVGQNPAPLQDFKKIKSTLQTLNYVKAFLPGGIGYAWILNDAGNIFDPYLLGVDFESYQKFFNHTIMPVEGRFFKPNERGVMLPKRLREMIFDYCNFWAIPQNTVLATANLTEKTKPFLSKLDIRQQLIFLGLSRKNASLDIASDVIGIFRYPALNGLLSFYCMLDMESFRECLGYLTQENAAADISTEQNQLLATDETDLNTLFQTDISAAATNKPIEVNKNTFEKKARPVIKNESEIYNIIFIKFKENGLPKNHLEKLNSDLKAADLKVKAVSWERAIGMVGQLTIFLKIALFLCVSFIFVVAILIIVNTLSLSAIERISEIGMMRAVGAKKRFIAAMFLTEISILSVICGSTGIITGIITVKIFQLLNLTAKNEVLQVFLGGDKFYPMIGLTDLGLCIIQLAVVTLLAVIYPIIVARRITALDAITRE